jgi:hypothetical protein
VKKDRGHSVHCRLVKLRLCSIIFLVFSQARNIAVHMTGLTFVKPTAFCLQNAPRGEAHEPRSRNSAGILNLGTGERWITFKFYFPDGMIMYHESGIKAVWKCVIWVSHTDDYEGYSLLGCDTVYFGREVGYYMTKSACPFDTALLTKITISKGPNKVRISSYPLYMTIEMKPDFEVSRCYTRSTTMDSNINESKQWNLHPSFYSTLNTETLYL